MSVIDRNKYANYLKSNFSELPKVSAYCPTYGRPFLLEEAIYSFLIQDYPGEKELIIINDYDKHQLKFDHPEIKIINIPQKMYILGEKFNYAVSLSSGSYLFPWEDDDIYLPHKISYSMFAMLNNNKPIFHTPHAFFEVKEKEFLVTSNIYHVNMALKKDLFDSVGGYYTSDGTQLDVNSMTRFFSAADNYESENVSAYDLFYIYRWGTTENYHGSGWAKENMSVLAEEFVKSREDSMLKGEYILKPSWKYNYTEYIDVFLKSQNFG